MIDPIPAIAILRTTPLDIVHAVVRGLENGDFLPGERLIEAELCLRFDVGRQIAREALQHLSARGIVVLAPNRGATIVRMTPEQAAHTLDVTELLFGLASRSAAHRVSDGVDTVGLSAAIAELEHSARLPDAAPFHAARRHFYAALTAIAGNEELSRLLEQVRVQVLRVQFGFADQRQHHSRELAAIGRMVLSAQAEQAEEASRAHVRGIKDRLVHP